MADGPRRPVRNTIEETSKKLPQGPLGFAGGGGLVGIGGLAVTELARAFTPGSELDPGYDVKSETISSSGGVERHTFVINAYNENIARMVAKLRTAPSNVDLLSKNIQVISSVETQSRRTASTWKITVNMESRN